MKSLKLATELSKKETEENLKELEQNESRLRAINTRTVEKLNEKRGTTIFFTIIKLIYS
jgi:hypothetical protein